MSWLDRYFNGYTEVEFYGAGFPTRTALNFLGVGVTVADNATNNSTDVTISAGSGSAAVSYTVVDYVGPLSPTLTIDAINELTMGGNINASPPAMTKGHWVGVKVLGSMSSHTLTMNAPAGKQIEVPMMGSTPPGTYAASALFAGSAYDGVSLSWYLDASGNLSLFP